jgi:hypothetical protein
MPDFMPVIHVFLKWEHKDVKGRAFATPKRLRPRRRVKSGRDEELFGASESRLAYQGRPPGSAGVAAEV